MYNWNFKIIYLISLGVGNMLVWRSEDSFVELALSFCLFMVSSDRTMSSSVAASLPFFLSSSIAAARDQVLLDRSVLGAETFQD